MKKYTIYRDNTKISVCTGSSIAAVAELELQNFKLITNEQ